MIGSDRCWPYGYGALLLVLMLVGISIASLWSPLSSGEQDVFVGESKASVPVFITPHHLAGREYIEAIFQMVSERVGGDSVRRIVLLSPNHFGVGTNWVIGSDEHWETPWGELRSDELAVEGLRGQVFFGTGILEREHGIRNLLPFVKRFFPKAALVPLAIREGMPHEDADAFARALDQISDSDTLLIVSTDFSHYLDWNFSRFHDSVALAALGSPGLDQLDSLDDDCVACLRIAKWYAELRSAPHFRLVARSSALELAGTNLAGEETSHLTGYFAPEAEVANPEAAHLLFSGNVTPDMMSENARRIYMGQHGNIFQRHGRQVINTFAVVPFDPWRSEENDDVLLTGGEAGLSVHTLGGLRIAFIEAGGAEVLDYIQRAKGESDFVVVIGQEGRAAARAWMEGGADLVLGTGESEIQSIEIYQKKLFFPSLGNISPTCRGRHCLGIFLGLGISRGQVEVLLMPVQATEEGVVLATGSIRERLLSQFGEDIPDEDIRQSLQAGRLVLSVP